MQMKGKPNGDAGGRLDETLDVGFSLWHQTIAALSERGLTGDSGSSALAVAVAAAIVNEGIPLEEFMKTLQVCLLLWHREERAEGPVLIFSCPIHPLTGATVPSQEPANVPGN